MADLHDSLLNASFGRKSLGILRPGAPRADVSKNLAAMTSMALAGDWQGCLWLARDAGELSPRPPGESPDPLEIHKVLLAAASKAAAESDGGARELIHRLAPLFPAGFIAQWASSSLWAYSTSFASPAARWPTAIHDLMSMGADPVASEAGADSAREGNFEALGALLDSGMDPSAISPGRMPLIFEALCKDRLHASSDKMECVKMLWSRGARFSSMIEGLPPSSLLEFLLLRERSFVGKEWLAGFEFNWNYFEETGLGPEALLPSPGDRAGISRLAKLAASPESAAFWQTAYSWLSDACRAAVAQGEALALSDALAPASSYCAAASPPRSL